MRHVVRSTRLVLFLILVISLMPAAALAASTATIDFEGLSEGHIVSSVSSGSGISGDSIPGTVSVQGQNNNLGAMTNAAIIFDSTCTGGCTGGDPDLEFPAQGNTLIVAENLVDANNDGLVDDPDDAAVFGARLYFNFSSFGPGAVTAESLWVGDTEEGGTIELFDANQALITTIPIPNLADHQATTLNIGAEGVTHLLITLFGSGAFDDLVISVPGDEPGNGGGGGTEGCTPGYWKQSHHLDSWTATGFSPNQTLESVFDMPDTLKMDNTTLQQALAGGGGPGVQGAAKILMRAAVASLLNSAHPDVDFTLATNQVITDVNAVLASAHRATMLDLASDLDTDNNLGCPLN